MTYDYSELWFGGGALIGAAVRFIGVIDSEPRYPAIVASLSLGGPAHLSGRRQPREGCDTSPTRRTASPARRLADRAMVRHDGLVTMRRAFVTARQLRVIAGVFFGFVALVEIPSVFDPGKGGIAGRIFAGLLVVAGAVFAIRGVRSATVIATDSGVIYRSLARTRFWPWDGIAQFEALDTRVGVMAWPRRVLFLRDSADQLHKCEELNARVSRIPNPVDDVAAALNRLVEGHRGSSA